MDCTICHKPVILVPSARAKARATGQPASYFTRLNREHTECAIAKRDDETLALMRRINTKGA